MKPKHKVEKKCKSNLNLKLTIYSNSYGNSIIFDEGIIYFIDGHNWRYETKT